MKTIKLHIAEDVYKELRSEVGFINAYGLCHGLSGNTFHVQFLMKLISEIDNEKEECTIEEEET